MASDEVVIESNAVQVHFAVRWFGLITIRGTFSRAEGRLAVPTGEVAHGELGMAVDARTVSTGLGLRDRHLRAERFLHADLHPWIRLTSITCVRNGGHLVVHGLLTLRGVTGPVRAACPIDEVQRDGEQVGASARFVVSRSRHGVGLPPGIWRFNPLLLAIADDVHVRVNIRIPAHQAERLGLWGQELRPRAATGHDDST